MPASEVSKWFYYINGLISNALSTCSIYKLSTWRVFCFFLFFFLFKRLCSTATHSTTFCFSPQLSVSTSPNLNHLDALWGGKQGGGETLRWDTVKGGEGETEQGPVVNTDYSLPTWDWWRVTQHASSCNHEHIRAHTPKHVRTQRISPVPCTYTARTPLTLYTDWWWLHLDYIQPNTPTVCVCVCVHVHIM